MRMVSGLLSEMVRPNALKTSTNTVIVRSNPGGDRDAVHASSAYSIPKCHAVHILVPFKGQSSTGALEDGQDLRVCPRPR